MACSWGDWATSKLGLSREVLIHSLRTAVAAVVSLLLARGFKLPQFYWAPISTIVILLSPINPMSLAWQRFVGTALGAVLGALIAGYFESDWVVYGIGILVCGIFSAYCGFTSHTALLLLRSALSCWLLMSTVPGSWLLTASWKCRWELR
jgi:uncharacterized membrane protein YccC